MRPYKPLIILSFLFVISSCKEDEEPLSTNIDAAFSSDITEVKEGNEVSFTDQSIGDPTTWTWTFEGGTPATSSEQNPTVSYNKTGTYSVSLIASNATYTDSIFKEKLISVTCDERYCTPQFTAYTKTNRISYGVDQNQHEMIIYQPEGDTKTDRPAVLLLGGGGFESGSNLDYLEPLAINLTKYGVVVAVARYRVNSQWPGQTRLIYAQQDSRTAVRFLKKEANTYGIDTNSIFAGGYSSGAFTALFHGYVDLDDLTAQEQAVFSQLGGIEGLAQGNSGYSSEVAGTISLAGGMYVTLNPITKADVPLFAIHGTKDTDVPYMQETVGGTTTYGSKAIVDQVLNVGLDARLYTIQDGDHSSVRLKSDDYIQELMYFIRDHIN